MLRYQSGLLFTLSTLFYSLPLLLGWTEQKQTIAMTVLQRFVEYVRRWWWLRFVVTVTGMTMCGRSMRAGGAGGAGACVAAVGARQTDIGVLDAAAHRRCPVRFAVRRWCGCDLISSLAFLVYACGGDGGGAGTMRTIGFSRHSP
jgi:hypothetical protein